MLLKIHIKSQQPAVSCVVSQAETELNEVGINADKTSEICLVLAEALNNVVEHAYRYAENGDIDIELILFNQLLTISIVDFGPEFCIPQGKENSEKTSDDLSSLPEGGFGWALIQMLTDELSLKRINEKNHLKLTMNIANAIR